MNSIYRVGRTWSVVSALIFTSLLTACDDEEPALPDNIIKFSATEVGISPNEDELEVIIQFSRAIDQATTIELEFEGEGVDYGTDFTTEPAASGNTIALNVPAGSTTTSFTVRKTEGLLLDGDESLTIALAGAGTLVTGDASIIVIAFDEILSTGATMDINGGGATYPNKVFIDLSANRQTAVDRNAWDLGFYSGDEFRVVLNSSVNMLARAIDKTDITTVTAADTIGFKAIMAVGNSATHAALPWVDDPSGALGGTAIAAISATASENYVYILNRGSSAKSWKKIRIMRSTTGYTMQYADIDAVTFTEISIPKSTTHLFEHVSIENGVVSAEPEKDKWEIAWTYFVNRTGTGVDEIPYGFQDVVLTNRHGVEVAKVLTSAVTYDAFDADGIAALTFNSSTQLSIGSDWRKTNPAPASAYDDRFYVVHDAAGNYYKLKFTSITKDGVRGTPQIRYDLVKSGE